MVNVLFILYYVSREDFDSHIAQNGTWFWDKDNIMLDPLPGFNETATLTNGFLSVSKQDLYIVYCIDLYMIH